MCRVKTDTEAQSLGVRWGGGGGAVCRVKTDTEAQSLGVRWGGGGGGSVQSKNRH